MFTPWLVLILVRYPQEPIYCKSVVLLLHHGLCSPFQSNIISQCKDGDLLPSQ